MKVHEWSKANQVKTSDTILAMKKMGLSDVTHPMHEVPESILENLPDAVSKIRDKFEPPTKPWDSTDNPWVPDLLSVKGKEERERAGYKCSWVSKDELNTFIEQGYTLANKKDYGGLGSVLPGEEGEDGTIIKRRELMLVETPIENWNAREEYYKRKIKSNSQGAQRIAQAQGKQAEAESGGGMALTENKFTSKQGY